MTNVLAASSVDRKNPSLIERTALIKPPAVKVKEIKRDYSKEIKDEPDRKTGIVARILKNDPDKPFYYEITPDVAIDMLKMNDSFINRQFDDKRIKRYTNQMIKGRWKPKNGSTISISAEGMLLDGQHRLLSLWLTGTTCTYLIVTGLDKTTMPSMDIGKPRNSYDVTYINGFGPNSRTLAQAVKLIILFKNRSIVKGVIDDYDVANDEVNDFEQNRGRMSRLLKDLEGTVKPGWIPKTNNYLTAAQWLFVYHTLRSLPGMDEEAKKFLDKFAFGNDLKATSPIKVLRTYFETEFKHLSKGYGKRNKTNKVSLTIKIKYIFEAWNLYINKWTGHEIKVDITDPVIGKPIYAKVA
jgi:hypothetical protein